MNKINTNAATEKQGTLCCIRAYLFSPDAESCCAFPTRNNASDGIY